MVVVVVVVVVVYVVYNRAVPLKKETEYIREERGVRITLDATLGLLVESSVINISSALRSATYIHLRPSVRPVQC